MVSVNCDGECTSRVQLAACRPGRLDALVCVCWFAHQLRCGAETPQGTGHPDVPVQCLIWPIWWLLLRLLSPGNPIFFENILGYRALPLEKAGPGLLAYALLVSLLLIANQLERETARLSFEVVKLAQIGSGCEVYHEFHRPFVLGSDQNASGSKCSGNLFHP